MTAPIELKDLARYAYKEMVRRAHELQTLIVADMAAFGRFGADALPNTDFLRRSIWDGAVRSIWQENHSKTIDRYMEEHTKLMGQIAWLEEMFAENKERENQAFADAMADYFRQRANDPSRA